jgi:hypothetical protein
MKKKIFIMLLIVVGVTLCACANNSNAFNDIGGDEIIEGSTEPTNVIYNSFDTYEELEEWMTTDENGNAPAMEEMELHGQYYKEFIEDLLEGKVQIAKPYWGENLMIFRNEDGFPNIDIMCWDDERPEVWFFCELGDRTCRFQLLYMNEDEIAYSQNHSIGEMHKYIYPSSHVLDELQAQGVYKNVFVEDITLQDRTVLVLTQKHDDDPRLYKYFVYDNLYVTMVVYEDSFNNANWQEFSLRTE